MKSITTFMTIVLVLSLTVIFTGCWEKGPAQKAGEKIDHAVEKTKDAVKDATN